MAPIKCTDCSVVKESHFFYKKQLAILEAKQRKNKNLNPAITACIRCMTCGPKQMTEMKCRVCDTVKGLDSFPNNQRRTPQNARCWKCHNKQKAEDEPDAGSDDEVGNGSEPEVEDDDDDDDEFSGARLSAPSNNA